ncbi:MAG TPA: AmmeMemoRadiSam system protein A [Micromonosporaceae bacterium]|jgi:AmmeMemoRadiSam system protein A
MGLVASSSLAVPLAVEDGAVLARRATAAVRARLAGRPVDGRPPARPPLRALGASFVTLERDGALRGCIGSLEPVRPLFVDVTRNAVKAMTDPRLAPVYCGEWPGLDVKVSVLSHPVPLPVMDRDELLAELRPGLDGLIFADDRRRATFLPAVWTKLPEPARFVTALLDKGGWPPGDWPARLRVYRYTAVEFFDRAPRAPL